MSSSNGMPSGLILPASYSSRPTASGCASAHPHRTSLRSRRRPRLVACLRCRTNAVADMFGSAIDLRHPATRLDPWPRWEPRGSTRRARVLSDRQSTHSCCGVPTTGLDPRPRREIGPLGKRLGASPAHHEAATSARSSALVIFSSKSRNLAIACGRRARAPSGRSHYSRSAEGVSGARDHGRWRP